MKRIKEYKKLFKVEGTINLKELKTTYRGLVKEWHPDKFQQVFASLLHSKEEGRIMERVKLISQLLNTIEPASLRTITQPVGPQPI